MKQYRVEEFEAKVSVQEYREHCLDIPRIRGYCQACENYGKRWSCPPFTEPSECLWDRYETIWIFGRKLLLSQELQDEEISMDEMTARSKALLHPEKERLLGELLELERQFPGSLALSAGSCEGCPPKQCARAEGKPCLHPERLRCSLESLGGDVVQTASRYLNQEILWGKAGHFPPSYLLVGALLLPKKAQEC